MLFRFLARQRARKAAEEAMRGGDLEAAIAAASAADGAHRRELLLSLADDAVDREELASARTLLGALSGGGADPERLLLQARVERGEGKLDDAARLYRELLMQFPTHEKLGRALAAVELDRGDAPAALRALERFEESGELDTRLLRAKALFAAGNDAGARAMTSGVVQQLEYARRHSLTTGGVDDQEYRAALELHEAVIAASEGAEEVTADAARRQQLDAYAGVNYFLLAGKLARQSERLAVDLELLSIEGYRELGARLLAEDPTSATGQVQLGVAALRDGDYPLAERHFTRARELDGSHFAAWSGFGVARMLDAEGAHQAVRRLPQLPAPAQVAAVFPQWPVLSPVERRLVLASLHPLRFALRALARRGAQLRVLPIDVRTVDLPELSELEEEEVDLEGDHRAFSSLHGLAGDRLAVVRLDALMQLSEEGWTLAHELAHLVHHNLDEEDRERIAQLHAAASEEEYAFSQYALSNEYELFACAYVSWLRLRYGLGDRAPDSEAWAAVASFLEELDRRD